MSKSRYILL